MSQVVLHRAPAEVMAIVFLNSAKVEVVKANLHKYTTCTGREITLEQQGVDAAEEMFDLTNNPCRELERDTLGLSEYRSVSVGDLVEVDGVKYLCCSSGWAVVEVDTVS